ncbi:MAG: murein biosynthesis integral membrane protein MurJ [Planctomycetaceae bacterium]|nr:murein biosynthesis integral membrane protein MurJ [Planctomycetaceae bacterium]
MNEHQKEHHREREHFFGAAKIVAALTILSRISGLFRNMAITALGANRVTSAFRVAFGVPNLFRRLFGEGALSAALIPVFSETAEKSGLEKARLLLSNLIALAAVVLSTLAVVIASGLVIWVWVSWQATDLRLLLTMTLIMLPFMISVCLLALAAAALNCRGHFVYPAFAPIILNLFQIAAAIAALKWISSTPSSLLLVSTSVPLAGLVQLLGIIWLLKRSGLGLVLRLRPLEPGIKVVLRLVAPALMGLGFLQFCELLQLVLGWVMAATPGSPELNLFGWHIVKPLDEGDVARIDTARQLYQLPMGVLAMSLATTIFPLLSRYASRNDMPALQESVNRAIRLSLLEGLAAGAGLFVLADPIIIFLFRRAKFTHDDALRAAWVLKYYCLGIWANCVYVILIRAFYALKDYRTPLKIAVVLTTFSVLSLMAMLIWIPQLGPASFGLSISLTTSLTVILLAAALRRRIGSFGDRQLALSIAKSVLATAIMVAAIEALLWALRAWHLDRPWLATIAGVTVGTAVLYLAAKLLRMPELDEMLGRLRKKSPPAKPLG